MSINAASVQEIERIYRDQYGSFLRTASAIANNRDGGRDAVHDAFVSAIRERKSYRGEGTIEAWLWSIVVRSALRFLRTEVRAAAIGGEPEPIFWPEQDASVHDSVRAAVARLPERQRLVLFLRYYGDLDYRTIAQAAGIQVGTVGAELHAAHRALRDQLKEAPSL